MAQKDRNKEFWLIPKRANLHQTVVLLMGIAELNYDKKAWKGDKQDRLGSYLAKKGSTNNGRTITPQSIRTLLASIPQYFGFVFINTDTTPNTLYITIAGYKLIDEFKEFFQSYKYTNLIEAEKNKGEIQKSETFIHQFSKLQITNPVILKDCENIFVFPLLFIIKLLKKIIFISYDELAYFVFKSKNDDEIDLIEIEINNFRALLLSDRKLLIETFKKTHLGNISLVQAPSASYFEKLCRYTEIFIVDKIILPNPENINHEKIDAIFLAPNKTAQINNLLIACKEHILYNFKNNISLWIDYIGNPRINRTPKDFIIYTSKEENILISITQDNKIIFSDLINVDNIATVPILETYAYCLNIINPDNGSIHHQYSFNFSHIPKIDLSRLERINIEIDFKDVDSIKQKILSHINSKNFDQNYANYLSIIEKLHDRSLLDNKNLRGGYLEYLFYRFLQKLGENGKFDDVIWNGKLGRFGLPIPAPGGTMGISDILVFKDDIVYVFELTTIKPKSMQWQAEGASVPDHLKTINGLHNNKTIIGFYLAPEIHDRITNSMKSHIANDKIELNCIKIIDFISDFNLNKYFK